MRLKDWFSNHYIKMEDNIKVIKTTKNDDFIKLVSALDQSLWNGIGADF
jgi:hypothetical protein